jgi:hypothetical protein
MTEPTGQIVEIEDLLEIVDLTAIDLYELRAKTITRDPDAEFEDQYTLAVALGGQENRYITRFTLTFEAGPGEYFVDLGVVYTLDKPATVPQNIGIEFVEKVSAMAAYPFLREHVYSLASRMGHPRPVLGLMKQGQFRMSQDEPN